MSKVCWPCIACRALEWRPMEIMASSMLIAIFEPGQRIHPEHEDRDKISIYQGFALPTSTCWVRRYEEHSAI